MLTKEENELLGHITMFGSAGYPIRKDKKGKWWVDRMFGAGGFPTPFTTKKKATEQFEQYCELLLEKHETNNQYSKT